METYQFILKPNYRAVLKFDFHKDSFGQCEDMNVDVLKANTYISDDPDDRIKRRLAFRNPDVDESNLILKNKSNKEIIYDVRLAYKKQKRADWGFRWLNTNKCKKTENGDSIIFHYDQEFYPDDHSISLHFAIATITVTLSPIIDLPDREGRSIFYRLKEWLTSNKES